MKINKITIGAEASYGYQKATMSMEIEVDNLDDVKEYQKQINALALENAKELADGVETLKDGKRVASTKNMVKEIAKETTIFNDDDIFGSETTKEYKLTPKQWGFMVKTTERIYGDDSNEVKKVKAKDFVGKNFKNDNDFNTFMEKLKARV